MFCGAPMKKISLMIAAALLVGTAASAAEVKSYQVTGPVLELTDNSITVQKGSEKWQIARGSVVLPPDVIIGSKVTIKYTMTANQITSNTLMTSKTAK